MGLAGSEAGGSTHERDRSREGRGREHAAAGEGEGDCDLSRRHHTQSRGESAEGERRGQPSEASSGHGGEGGHGSNGDTSDRNRREAFAERAAPALLVLCFGRVALHKSTGGTRSADGRRARGDDNAGGRASGSASFGGEVLRGVSDHVHLRRRSVCAGEGVVCAVEPMLLYVGSRLVASFHGADRADRTEDFEGGADGSSRSHRCCRLERCEHEVVAYDAGAHDAGSICGRVDGCFEVLSRVDLSVLSFASGRTDERNGQSNSACQRLFNHGRFCCIGRHSK